MTFDEWWKLSKPAECDEVKMQFEECWRLAHQAGRESMREEVCSLFAEFDIVGSALDTRIKELK